MRKRIVGLVDTWSRVKTVNGHVLVSILSCSGGPKSLSVLKIFILLLNDVCERSLTIELIFWDYSARACSMQRTMQSNNLIIVW